MKMTNLTGKNKLELKNMIVERKRELLNLEFQRVNGLLTNPARFKIIRREIAKIKTFSNLDKLTGGNNNAN